MPGSPPHESIAFISKEGLPVTVLNVEENYNDMCLLGESRYRLAAKAVNSEIDIEIMEWAKTAYAKGKKQ